MTKVQPMSEAEYLAQFAEAGDVDGLRMYWAGWLSSRTTLLVAQLRRSLARRDSAREVEQLLAEEESRFAAEDARYAAAVDRARDVRAARRVMDREGLLVHPALGPSSPPWGHPDVDGFDPCDPSGGAA